MSSWNLQRISYFVAVAEAPSLSAAARKLGISQPSLTMAIRKFEQELGFELFDRNHGFETTALGLGVLSGARRILTQFQDLDREIELLRAGELGTLRIACGPSVADGLVGRAVASLVRNRPKLCIEIEVRPFSGLPPILRERKIDLFVGDITLIEQADDLEIEHLPSQEVVFFCRVDHPLAGRKKVTPEEFCSYPAIATDLPPWAEAWLRKQQSPLGQAPGLTVMCSHHALLRRVVLGSDAVSAAPREVIQTDFDAGLLTQIDLVAAPLHLHAGVVRLLNRSLAPGAVQLIEELRRAAAGG